MITDKQVKDHENDYTVDADGQWYNCYVCHRCLKTLRTYKIAGILEEEVEDKDEDNSILICKECWQNIAGTDWMFESV